MKFWIFTFLLLVVIAITRSALAAPTDAPVEPTTDPFEGEDDDGEPRMSETLTVEQFERYLQEML